MKKTLFVVLAMLGLFVYGCAQSGGGTHTAASSAGQVALPEGIAADGLEVVSLNEIASIDSAGRFDVRLPEKMVAFVMVRDAATKTPVYYGQYFPQGMGTGALDPFLKSDSGIVISDASTALALAMINPLFFNSTLEQKAEIAEKIIGHAKFAELTEAIAFARSENFYGTLSKENNYHLYVMAKELAVAALRDNATAHIPREVQAQKLVFDKEMAWPETAGSNNIRFRNPKFVYYAAAPYSGANMAIQYPILVNPKEEIINFSIWPPSFEVVDTMNTLAGVPSGSYSLKIYKGIMRSLSPETLWNTDPARVALLANIWLTIQMTVSLCGDVGILPGGSVGVDILFSIIQNVPAEWIYALYQEINDKDVMGVINLFVDFFKANAGSIAGQVSGSFSGGSSDPAAASSLISQASELTGIATSLFDVVNSEVPFFYDLITSHEGATYNIVNGVVQDNAPNDTSSSSSSCAAAPTSGNGSIFVLLVLAPLAFLAVRRRVLA